MINIIWEFLSNNFPQIAGYFLFVCLFGFAVFKATKFYIKISNTCNDHGEIKKKLNLLLEKFSSLITALYEKEIIKDAGMFETKSPVKLSAAGDKFVEDIGWKNIMDNEEKRQNLFDLLDKLNLKTKADAERYSLIVLNELYSSREINPFAQIKEYLYNNANVNKQTAIYACSLYLRDRYLEIHPEIK
ncbi:MAG: hypothetical protein V1667_02420 [bacterium]